jgi:hypothetical protein
MKHKNMRDPVINEKYLKDRDELIRKKTERQHNHTHTLTIMTIKQQILAETRSVQGARQE